MNELKVTFYLKKNEERADGTVPVLGRIRIGKSMVQFSTKVYVVPNLWDVDVKNAFQGISSEQETLVSYYGKFNENFFKKVGINRKLETYKRYCVALNHLKDFLRIRYNVKDMPFQSLTPSFVSSYDLYLRADLKMRHNTIVNIIANLRSVIKSALNDGLLRQDPFIGYTFEYSQTVPRFLSEKELKLMMRTPLPKSNLNLVRDVFLFSAFTGISFSDLRNLTEKNLVQAEDGTWWIHSARQKTGTPFHVPLLELPLELIEKYRGITKNGRLFPMLSCSKTNINLKKIAAICGINRRVTFHQARHTYASVITLSQGVPLDTVRELMGHRDWRATRIYAHLTYDKVNEDMGKLQKRITDKFRLAEEEHTATVMRKNQTSKRMES